ncbi:unnamed protein product [Linum tenue]|uniref:Uncharacterized protein n=1 Tax=Linum tenue TaxID=586396 RepID=A0AAV0KF00_9ROSI|nr:unnamed protein product [Linum tenue]
MDSVAERTDDEFVSKIQGRGGATLLAEAGAEEHSAAAGGRRRISFTSWSRLGLYDVDFRWGKLVWVG